MKNTQLAPSEILFWESLSAPVRGEAVQQRVRQRPLRSHLRRPLLQHLGEFAKLSLESAHSMIRVSIRILSTMIINIIIYATIVLISLMLTVMLISTTILQYDYTYVAAPEGSYEAVAAVCAEHNHTYNYTYTI